MPFEVAICDDCKADREYLIGQILKHSGNDLRIHEYCRGFDLLDAMQKIHFSAIYLDIQMKGLNGNEVAREIRELDKSVVLVFYTGFEKPLPASFEVQPYRYIMKDMAEREIKRYIADTYEKILANGRIPTVKANIRRRQFYIKAEHITYIEKYQKGLRLHMAEHAVRHYALGDIERNSLNEYDFRIHEKLKTVYERLRKYGYGWPHDSYIINFQYMSACTVSYLCLDGVSGVFQISRGKKKEFNRQKDTFLCMEYTKKEVLHS